MTETPESEDWAGKATEFVEHFTAIIRDHSVKPLTGALRMLVVGLVIGLIAIVAFVVVVIGGLRLLDEDVFSGRVWASDVIVGGIFVIGGMFSLRQGTRMRNRNG